MSREIDEKVVEMRFDNKDFEKNVATSMSTLDKLKHSLKLDGAGKAFDDISRASGRVDLGGLSGGLGTVREKLEAIKQVAAFSMIASEAIKAKDAVTRFVKSMTIDQIGEGYNKYNSKMGSVQAIMSATRQDFEDSAEQMNVVNEQLGKLQWFTDETSYKYTDMVDNIGKFTSAGRGLEESVAAMQGISTWAANAGATVNEAGRAMYNLSQAMGMDYVQLMDWKSIENANMATMEFKKQVLEAAVAEGKLRKTGENTYKTIGKGTTVTAETMRETLNEKWFTGDVLMNVLNQYGGFANKLHAFYEQTGMETTALLSYINDYAGALADDTADGAKKAEEIIKEVAEESKLSAEEVKAVMDELGGESMKLGRESFAAAQETRTLADAIAYVKDAVSSGWMRTFELIFGDYMEAKALWSDLSDVFYEVFVASGDARNEMLEAWNEIGGREVLIEGLMNILEGLVDVVHTVKEAFYDFLPEDSEFRANGLLELTKKFKDLTDKIRPGEEALQRLKTIFKGVFAAFDIARIGISSILKILSPLFGTLPKAAGGFFGLLEKLAQGVIRLDEAIKASKVTEFVDEIQTAFSRKLSRIYGFFESSSKSAVHFSDVLDAVKAKLRVFATAVKTHLAPIGNAVKQFVQNEDIKGVITSIGKTALRVAKGAKKVIIGLAGAKGIAGVASAIIGFVKKLTTVADSVGFKEKIGGLIDTVADSIKGMKDKIKTDDLLKVAAAIGILTFSLYTLSTIDPIQLSAALAAMTASFLELVGAMKLLSLIKNVEPKSMGTIAATLVALALAVWILSKALSTIGQLDIDQVVTGIVGVVVLLGSMVGAMALLLMIDLSGAAKIMAAAAAMVLMAVAIRILASSVSALGEMDTGQMIQGLIGVGVLLLEIAGFAAIMAYAVGPAALLLIPAAAGVILLGIGLKLLCSSVAQLGSLDMATLAQGIAAIGVMMGMIVGLMYLIAPAALFGIKGAVGFLIIALALKPLVKALRLLAQMTGADLQHAQNAMGLLSSVMKTITGELIKLSLFARNGLKSSFAFLIMVEAVQGLIRAMKKLSSVNTNGLDESIDLLKKMMNGIAAVMIGTGFFAKKALKGAFSFMSISAALKPLFAVLIPALESFSEIAKKAEALDAEKASAGLKAVAGGIVRIGLALKAYNAFVTGRSENFSEVVESLHAMVEPMQAFSEMDHAALDSAFTSIASGIWDLGLSLKTFGLFSGISSDSLQTVVNSLTVLNPALKSFNELDAEKTAESFALLAKGFEQFGGSMKSFNFFSKYGADAMPKLAQASIDLGEALATILKFKTSDVEKVLDALGTAFSDFGTALDNTPILFVKGKAEGLGLLCEQMPKLASGLKRILDLGNGDVIGTRLTLIGEAFKKFGDALQNSPWYKADERGSAIANLIGSIEPLAKAINIFKKIDDKTLTAVIPAIGDAIVALGTAMDGAPLFGAEARGKGVHEIASSLSSVVTALNKFKNLNYSSKRLQKIMTDIGDGFKAFGDALNDTKLYGIEKKAEGLSKISDLLPKIAEPIEKLAGVEKNLTKLTAIPSLESSLNNILLPPDDAAFGSVISSISKVLSSTLSDIADVLTGSAFEIITDSKRADSLSTLISSLNGITEPLISLADTDISKIREASKQISEILNAIGGAVRGDEIGANVIDVGLAVKRAEAMALLIGALKDISAPIVELSKNNVSTDSLRSYMEALKETASNFAELLTELSVIGGDSAKASILLDIAQAVKVAGEALGSVSGLNQLNVFNSVQAMSQWINNIVEALNHVNGKMIGEKVGALSQMGTTLSELAVTVASMKDANGKNAAQFLYDLSNAFSDFSINSDKAASALTMFRQFGTNAGTYYADGYCEVFDSRNDDFDAAGQKSGKATLDGMRARMQLIVLMCRIVMDQALTAIKGYYNKFYDVGQYVADGFIEGVGSSDKLLEAAEAGKALAKSAYDAAKNYTEQDSPSKLFYQLGDYCTQGFVNSFYDAVFASEAASVSFAESAVEGAEYVINQMDAVLQNTDAWTPTIRPVLDLRDISYGMQALTRTELADRTALAARLAGTGMDRLLVQKSIQQTVRVNNGDVVSEIKRLRSDINTMSERIDGMQVTLDGRKLVGALSRPMDRRLGQMEARSRKG